MFCDAFETLTNYTEIKHWLMINGSRRERQEPLRGWLIYVHPSTYQPGARYSCYDCPPSSCGRGNSERLNEPYF